MTESEKLGLYIHIPFCRSRCAYCGFYSIEQVPSQKFIDALIREIERKSKFFSHRSCDTVYFGGGTPSVLTVTQLNQIMSALKSYFDILSDAEVTMEMNPCDMNYDYAAGVKALGINRVSIGVQSKENMLLKQIGRQHSSFDAKKAIKNAVKVGFTNISIDLMCELPGQTVEDFQNTLYWAVHLPITHMSVYSLIIEEGTRFHYLDQKGILARPTEGESWHMYQDMCKILPHYGMERYEISSFARKGYKSKHNTKYWVLDDYLGLGPAACSRIGRERRENLPGVKLYEKALLSDEAIPEKIEKLSEKEEMEEFCFLGLRQTVGISKGAFKKRYGKDIHVVYERVIKKLIQENFLKETDTHIYLTYQGMAHGNYAFEQFLLSV